MLHVVINFLYFAKSNYTMTGNGFFAMSVRSGSLEI